MVAPAELSAPGGKRALPSGKPTFTNLLNIALDALNMRPPDYIRSVLGPVRTWLPPHNPYSEFTVLDPWRVQRMLKYLVDVSVPSASGGAPPLLAALLPPALEDLFFVRTEVLHRPDYYDDYTSYPDEHWFFINGILTNGDVAQLNAACISYLFHRPVTLIQNATDGFVRDLYECALGKEWYKNTSNTEAARIAFPPIYDALKDPFKKKVVVICHSQGTIIMGGVLHALEALAPVERELMAQPVYVFQDEMDLDPADFEPLSEAEWAKLEVYCFATCANDMRYHSYVRGGRPTPWLEHYGNERDLVARLGMLAPRVESRGVCIEGPLYVRPKAWGHLLNIDYLLPILAQQKHGRRRGGTGGAGPFELRNPGWYAGEETPRLYRYINGG